MVEFGFDGIKAYGTCLFVLLLPKIFLAGLLLLKSRLFMATFVYSHNDGYDREALEHYLSSVSTNLPWCSKGLHLSCSGFL